METSVSEIIVRMIGYSDGNLHDIDHFLKVFAYAGTIAGCEGLPADAVKTVEIAAVIHDIACPLCREKYGDTNGRHQEKEGAVLAEEFLRDIAIPDEMKQRVVWLVGHHHTVKDIDGEDHQILIEADYLVNAEESGFSRENIRNARDRIFKTSAGRRLLGSIYLGHC